jgi:hypothetical protein
MTIGELQELLHGKERGSNTIEAIVCPDGFKVSVQASRFHYCSPREDNPDVWDEVELGFPSEVVPEWKEYAEGNDYTNTVYPYVPVSVVVAVLVQHGWGMKKDIQVVYKERKKELYAELLSTSRRIQDLTRQKLGTLAELEKAYAIQSLFVDAEIDPFKLGSVSVIVDDPVSTRPVYVTTPNPDAKLRVHITRFDNGERTEFLFPLADVPEVLWSDVYKRAVERQRRKEKQA